jgi:hypothetical protein
MLHAIADYLAGRRGPAPRAYAADGPPAERV